MANKSMIYRLLISPERVSVVTHDDIRYLTDHRVITWAPIIGEAFAGLPDGAYKIHRGKPPEFRGDGHRWPDLQRLIREYDAAEDWSQAEELGLAVTGPWWRREVSDSLLLRTVAGDQSEPFAVNRGVFNAWRELLHPLFRACYSPSLRKIRFGAGNIEVAAYLMPIRHDGLGGTLKSLERLLGDSRTHIRQQAHCREATSAQSRSPQVQQRHEVGGCGERG
jgi:hypothetical protein